MASLGSTPTTESLQSHGTGSANDIVKLRSMAEIQARLRHATDATTKRHAKKVCYVAELGKLSPGVMQYGTHGGENLARALAGTSGRVAPRPQQNSA